MYVHTNVLEIQCTIIYIPHISLLVAIVSVGTFMILLTSIIAVWIRCKKRSCGDKYVSTALQCKTNYCTCYYHFSRTATKPKFDSGGETQPPNHNQDSGGDKQPPDHMQDSGGDKQAPDHLQDSGGDKQAPDHLQDSGGDKQAPDHLQDSGGHTQPANHSQDSERHTQLSSHNYTPC